MLLLGSDDWPGQLPPGHHALAPMMYDLKLNTSSVTAGTTHSRPAISENQNENQAQTDFGRPAVLDGTWL